MPNEIVEQCNVLINIPANPEYSSLNLSQAAQVVAYECRVAALGDGQLASPVGFHGDAASLAQVDGMYEHLSRRWWPSISSTPTTRKNSCPA